MEGQRIKVLINFALCNKQMQLHAVQGKLPTIRKASGQPFDSYIAQNLH